MELFLQGLVEAFRLIFTLDPELTRIALLSLRISGTATLLAIVLGLGGGLLLALTRFPGRKLALAAVNTGMGLPPVVVGLFVSIMLWRSGPLGALGLLYTPTAMIVAQTVIATPIVMGISAAALQNLPDKLRLQILALGATRAQLVWVLIREARLPLL